MGNLIYVFSVAGLRRAMSNQILGASLSGVSLSLQIFVLSNLSMSFSRFDLLVSMSIWLSWIFSI